MNSREMPRTAGAAREAAQEARREALQAIDGLENFVEQVFAGEYEQAEAARQRAVRKLKSALRIADALPQITGDDMKGGTG